MRTPALAPLLVLPLALAGCGASGPSGSEALKVVKGDWEFNHAFTGRDAAYADYDAVDHIECDGRPDASGDVQCRLEVSSSKLDGRKREARVVVHYDQQGILQGWDRVPPER